LLAEGEDYYTENNEGASALDLAAFYGHIDLLNLFIQAGADASDINYSSRKSPLEYAIENPANVPNRLATVAILLDHGNTLPPQWIKKLVKRMAASKVNSRTEIEKLLNQHMEAEHAPAPLRHPLLGPPP
jgi:ankyrin repeat protein